MTPEPEPTPTPSPCHCGMNGCETGCGRRAPRSWIWMALAVAVLVFVKNQRCVLPLANEQKG